MTIICTININLFISCNFFSPLSIRSNEEDFLLSHTTNARLPFSLSVNAQARSFHPGMPFITLQSPPKEPSKSSQLSPRISDIHPTKRNRVPALSLSLSLIQSYVHSYAPESNAAFCRIPVRGTTQCEAQVPRRTHTRICRIQPKGRIFPCNGCFELLGRSRSSLHSSRPRTVGKLLLSSSSSLVVLFLFLVGAERDQLGALHREPRE